MYKQQHMQQQTIEQTTAAAGSVAAAGTGVIGLLADFNVVLVSVATVIAILSGGWSLYDKYQQRKGEKNASTTNVQRGTGSGDSPASSDVGSD